MCHTTSQVNEKLLTVKIEPEGQFQAPYYAEVYVAYHWTFQEIQTGQKAFMNTAT